MNQKKYKNSIMIEGNYNFNYLTNLLFLCEQCLYQAIENNDFELKKNKKMLKNIKNLCSFFDSSIDVFSKLSIQNNEEKIIIHSVDYDIEKNEPVVVNDLVSELEESVINKDKEVDFKYDEEE